MGVEVFADEAAFVRTLHDGSGISIARRVTSPCDLEPDATHFVIALGPLVLEHPISGSFALRPGMFVSCPGPAQIDSVSHQALVASKHNYRGLFCLGGPIEPEGRLRYIDGCSDTVLVAPARLGDPCLNHLHIPAHTAQSRHTHPTVRIGCVVAGHGLCVTPETETPLSPGTAFTMEPGAMHCFHTDSEPLTVIAYHPDSDTGPTDEDHPMVNRTLLGQA